MERAEVLNNFQVVRLMTKELCKPLLTEDYVIQTMVDVSPPKWHLGHTTWFFEQVILNQFVKNYRPFHEGYYFVFNSYYQSFGERVDRNRRGMLSRPTVREVYEYREAVEEMMQDLINSVDSQRWQEVDRLVILGLHHEQQHQELLVTDIKHIFASNPLSPVYRQPSERHNGNGALPRSKFIPFEGGTSEVGATDDGFAWDNERPRHKQYLREFSLMDRLVTCGEYLEFMYDGGYTDPLLWLSDGWEKVQNEHWGSPLYWEKRDGKWFIVTLTGERAIDQGEPVSHVSYYEAAAYGRWAGKRLPSEAEWEHAATWMNIPATWGNFLEDGHYHPVSLAAGSTPKDVKICQMFGDVWEWTGSAYLGYPGYRQEMGPLGEYNGKFMSNQMVLRGGSCATPRSHIRPTYRNFFQCDKRWQFTGFRLADDH